MVLVNTEIPLPATFPVYMLKVTRNTLMLGLLTTFWSLLIAVPVSILIVKFNIRFVGFWTALMTVPMITPPLITSFAVIILLGRSGIITLLLRRIGIEIPSIYGLNGLLITQILHTVPYAVLILIAGLKGIPRHLEEAAFSMGSSVLSIQLSVVIPYIMPHILMSGLMVFLSSIGDIGSPLLIGGNFNVLSLSIYSNYISFMDDERIPIILSLWIILLSFIILNIVNRVFQITNKRYRIGYDTMVYDNPLVRKCSYIIISILSALFLLPNCIVLIHSFAETWINRLLPSELTFNNYEAVFINNDSVINTLILSAIAVPIMIILGLILSYMFRKINRLKWLNYITLVPFILPGVVIAISLLKTFADVPFPGDSFTSSFTILVIAVSVRRLPYVIKTLEAGFCKIDRKQEEIAAGFGADDLSVFFTILFPQMKPFLFSALFIATVKVFTELASSLIINPPGWKTLSVYIAYYVEEGHISRAAAMGVVLVLIVLSGSAFSKFFSGKSSGKLEVSGQTENWESVILGKVLKSKPGTENNIYQTG